MATPSRQGRIVDSMLGFESHGILTAQLVISFGNLERQATPTFNLANGRLGLFVVIVLQTMGRQQWEQLIGVEVVVDFDEAGYISRLHLVGGAGAVDLAAAAGVV